MLIVGYGARARSGKDTCVEHMVKVLTERGLNAVRYSFGDCLKAEFYNVLASPEHDYWLSGAALLAEPQSWLPVPFSTEVAEDAKLLWIAEHKQALGHHLQVYATEFVRAQDPFHFTNAVRKKLLAESPQVALISDVRFRQEYWLVKSHGGFLVRVTRENYVLNDGRDANHASETSLDNARWDYEITAPSGAIAKLQNDAEAVFADIERRVSTVTEEAA